MLTESDDLRNQYVKEGNMQDGFLPDSLSGEHPTQYPPLPQERSLLDSVYLCHTRCDFDLTRNQDQNASEPNSIEMALQYFASTGKMLRKAMHNPLPLCGHSITKP